MQHDRHIAHFNVARLRHEPGDPRVAEFVDNVPRVNGVAERSPGYVWRWSEPDLAVNGTAYQAVDGDPRLAISLSVWERPEDLRFFVKNTVHGAFLRRREAWFEPWDGPNYVVWWVAAGEIPAVAEGWARLERLARDGNGSEAFDFRYAPAFPPA